MPGEGPESIVVATFGLRRAYRPDLWDEAVAELEVVARDLAERLGPSARLSSGRTRAIGGARSRVYDIRYEGGGGVELIERVAFLFDRAREFQLACRIDADDPERGEDACSTLFDTFELVR